MRSQNNINFFYFNPQSSAHQLKGIWKNVKKFAIMEAFKGRTSVSSHHSFQIATNAQRPAARFRVPVSGRPDRSAAARISRSKQSGWWAKGTERWKPSERNGQPKYLNCAQKGQLGNSVFFGLPISAGLVLTGMRDWRGRWARGEKFGELRVSSV